LCPERIDYPVSQTFGNVGVLFTVLRSESGYGYGGDGDGADYFEALGDLNERVLPIAVRGGTGFDADALRARLAWHAWGSWDSGVTVAIADNSP
jgi:hypothetical protein